MKPRAGHARLLYFLLPLGLMALLVQAATAADRGSASWPQWRGPNRDGRSAETGLLATWPEGGPELLWRYERVSNRVANIPSPVVCAKRLLFCDQDTLFAYDVAAR